MSGQELIKRKGSQFVRFVVADLAGLTYEITPDDFNCCPALTSREPVYGYLRQFVANELAQREPNESPPKHIAYMQAHDLVDYCDVSEKGHYKWYPKGLLIQKLLLDYAAQIAQEWGAFEMRNPLVIRGEDNLVGQLMGEFHERDYRVDGGRGVCYLRYASDPLAFPFLQKCSWSHRQSPLRVYEEASCFRNEQQGEVSGLKRVRNFLMTDMHAACADQQEAREEFEWLCRRFASLMNDVIAKGRWVLGWEGTIAFYEQNRDWLVSIGRSIGVPAFFKLMPEMSHYYAIKNEYQAICEDGSNVQVSTVQWDVKDGPRFDIGFVDERGHKQPCPVILHASSFGSIERTLCAILENIAIDARRGQVPMYPLWLAPTQVRILPVSQEYNGPAEALCGWLSEQAIRADVDDRDGTVGRKIRDGEKEWLPYLVVFGEKERQGGPLAVRVRESGRQEKITGEQLARLIHDQVLGMPVRPVPLARLLSRRPIFTR